MAAGELDPPPTAEALAWLHEVPAIDVIGFSLTGFGDATSFGKLLEQQLAGHGWRGSVREISYGGLAINGLAGLIGLASRPVTPGDVIALELATSFFSTHKYTLQDALPLVFAIARHFAERGHRVFFLNLFRADLDDRDCVVRAIEAASERFGIPVLDLKTPFRRLSTDKPYGTTDGIHPDPDARRLIAGAMAAFLGRGPWPAATPTTGGWPSYHYLDLAERLPALPRHAYEARGKAMSAAVAPAGFEAEIALDGVEHVVGFCFLYGPETGFVEVQVGDRPPQELITFDEHSYYRRVGFRPLDVRGDRVRLRVLPKVREIALVRPTNLPAQGRCDFLCGLVLRRPPPSSTALS